MLSNCAVEDSVVRVKDTQAKERMKQDADKRRRAKTSVIEVGDMVLIRQRKENKFSTRFDPHPFCVTKIKGTMITAIRNGKYVTRNVSLLKKVNPNSPVTYYSEEEEDDDDDENQDENTENPPTAGDGDAPSPHVVNPPDTARRYPTRNRKACARYGQNIYDN